MARVRAVVLTGDGGAFASGGDLRELSGKHSRDDAERFAEVGARALPGHRGARASPSSRRSPAPRSAAAPSSRSRATFGSPSWRADFVQARAARGDASLGNARPSRRAHRRRVLRRGSCIRQRRCPPTKPSRSAWSTPCSVDGGCLELALEWARQIAEGSPDAISRMKSLVRAAAGVAGPRLSELERAHFVATWTGADHVEAMSAYFDRRPPRWQPRS